MTTTMMMAMKTTAAQDDDNDVDNDDDEDGDDVADDADDGDDAENDVFRCVMPKVASTCGKTIIATQRVWAAIIKTCRFSIFPSIDRCGFHSF